MLKKKPVYLLLAIILALAAVIKEKPHLVFKVPYIGWILAIPLGYGVPSFLDLDAFGRCYDKDACPWLKSGDVVVDVCTKCGTNWMLTVVHELRTWDQPELRDFRDILDIAPWPELRPHPAADFDHPETEWQSMWNHSDFRFREFKAHVAPFRTEKGIRVMQMPVRERRDVKYVVMVRNPVDTIVSLYHFSKAHRDSWKRLWGGGGFTPMKSVGESIEMMETYEDFAPSTFFSNWLEFAGEENVLFLHYTSVFKDTKKHLKIIAEFLGIHNIPEETFDEIQKRVGIEHMKKIGDRYLHLAGVNKSIPLLKPAGLVRAGGLGSKDSVTPEQKARIHNIGRDKLSLEEFNMFKDGFEAILNKKSG